MSTQLTSISDHLSKQEYAASIQVFDSLTAAEKREPELCYQIAYAFLQLHKPFDAEPLLEQAAQGGFYGYEGLPTSQDLLQMVSEIKSLTPPHCRNIGDGSPAKIQLFAQETAWTASILQALPAFLDRAQEIFGKDVPPINFYFFPERPNFEDFYTRIFGVDIPTSWHDGTGNANIVVFCEQDRNGQVSRPAGVARTTGDVLHEYGHALCNTIFGDNYLERVPQWLDEGMADAIASPYYESLFKLSDQLLSSESSRRSAPSYSQLCYELYREPDLGYAIARVMVGQLVAEQGISVIARIIDSARQASNFENVVKTVSKLDGPTLYQSVIDKYWKESRSQ